MRAARRINEKFIFMKHLANKDLNSSIIEFQSEIPQKKGSTDNVFYAGG